MPMQCFVPTPSVSVICNAKYFGSLSGWQLIVVLEVTYFRPRDATCPNAPPHQDVFVTILDWRWRYTLLAFLASFMLSWLLFAVLWWLIAYCHGDYLPENLANDGSGLNGTWTPCILANKNFASAFLFR